MKITLNLVPGYPQMLSGKILLRSEGRFIEHFKACAAQLALTKILYRDSKAVPLNIVPRFRQHAIKLVPGLQKLRHASLITALVDLSS